MSSSSSRSCRRPDRLLGWSWWRRSTGFAREAIGHVRLVALAAALLLASAAPPASASTHSYEAPSLVSPTPTTPSTSFSLTSPSAVARSAAAAGTIAAADRRLSAAEDTGAQTLFRADSRSPEEIFRGGFEPKGSNMDLWAHVTENPADSGFVSTSKSLGAAQEFAEENGVDYIYRVRANGVDVNATLGENSPFPWEHEVAVPGPISSGSVEGAWGPGGWLANPFGP